MSKAQRADPQPASSMLRTSNSRPTMSPANGSPSACHSPGRWRATDALSIPTSAIPSSIIRQRPWPASARPTRTTTMPRASTAASSRSTSRGATSASSSISTASIVPLPFGWMATMSATRRDPIPMRSLTSPQPWRSRPTAASGQAARQTTSTSSPCASIAGATDPTSKDRTCGTFRASTATSISSPHPRSL